MEGQEHQVNDEVDEFAPPPPSAGQKTDGKVNGESTGELLVHSLQAHRTKTKEEREVELTYKYGDLADVADRKCMIFYEKIFTMDRGKLDAHFVEPPSSSLAEGRLAIPLGVNTSAGYMLEGPVGPLRAYMDCLRDEERRSVSAGLLYQLQIVKDSETAKTKLAYVRALMEHDAELKPLLKEFENGFCKRAVKLAIKEKKQGGQRKVTKTEAQERPNEGALPEVKFLCGGRVAEDFIPRTKDEEGDVFSIYTCSMSTTWNKALEITTTKGFVPSCAHNDAYFAVVTAHANKVNEQGYLDQLVLKVQGYNLREGSGLICHWAPLPPIYVALRREDGYFDMDLATFVRPKFQDGRGSKLGIGLANGVIVVDFLEDKEEPRMACFSPIGEKIGRTITSLCLPPGGGKTAKLVMSTSYGESCGVNLDTGAILHFDLTPAVEGIFHTCYSNNRIVMQTATSICAEMTPFLPNSGLTHLEVSRPLCTVVIGTLIFVLEKYGRIFIYNTLIRNMVAPFRPPSTYEFGLGIPVPHSYAGLAATPTTLMVMYPNGLICRFSIGARYRQDIETYALRGKMPKQKLAKQQKRLVKAAKQKKKQNEKK